MYGLAIKPRVDLSVGCSRIELIGSVRRALWNSGDHKGSMKFKSEAVGAQSIDETYKIAQGYAKLYVEGVAL